MKINAEGCIKKKFESESKEKLFNLLFSLKAIKFFSKINRIILRGRKKILKNIKLIKWKDKDESGAAWREKIKVK